MMIAVPRYNKWVAVTPSDGTDFLSAGKGSSAQAILCDALYIGAAGDVTAVMQDGTAVLFKAVPLGMLYIQCKRVNAAGTTATNIVALYQH